MRLHILAALFLSSVMASAAPAPTPAATNETSETKLKMDDVTEKKNKVDGDLDKEITNPKLRADSGSKSKYSGSATMNYRGGSVSRPFGVERPNLAGLPENQVDSSLDGSLKIRYRSSMNNSFTTGVTLGVKTPLQGDMNKDNGQLNVGDPNVGYNRTFAAFGLQNSWNVSSSAGTSQESNRIDQTASVATDYTVMVPVERLHIGLFASTWYNFFSTKPGEGLARYRINDSPHSVDSRTGAMLTFYPTVEYYVTDKIALRTLFSYFRWAHLYGDRESWSLLPVKPFQSVGVGISVTRDIYLYPNVQFLVRDVRSDYTNVSLSATINMF